MKKKLETYKIEITWQPINKCWGILLKKGNIVHNEVDKLLSVAMFNMEKYILKLPIK